MGSYAAALWPQRFDLDGGGAEHMGLALIVHGGAGAMASDRFDAAREGCRAATAAGWAVLLAGGSAVAAVEGAVVALENKPSLHAGTGGLLPPGGGGAPRPGPVGREAPAGCAAAVGAAVH